MSLSEVVVDESDGFVDFRLPVLHSAVSENGEAVLIVGGSYFDRSLEVTFRLHGGMSPNDLFAENVTVNSLADGIKVSLVGEGGRNFASALSGLYKSDRSSFLLPLDLSFTAVALSGNPANIAAEIVKFKLFHETGSTDEDEGPDYFEMFFNVDLASGFVELNEKDTEFRSGVLYSLSPEPN